VTQTRRRFLETVSAAAVAGGVPALEPLHPAQKGQNPPPWRDKPRPGASSWEDPLGVRGDFPITQEWAYLDSPYITPSPRQVVEAGQRFLEAKGRDPVSLGDMLDETTAVRQKFARLIGASEREVGIASTTIRESTSTPRWGSGRSTS
jgi:hypothetical protein